MDAIRIPELVVEKLKSAQKVAVLTGAGASKESGIPTFREAQTGLWAQYDPTELATPHAFRRNPQLVWAWYRWRRELVGKAVPNPGHYALVDMEKFLPDFTLITQNVDGLHERAGSQRIIELHGNITRNTCFDEGRVLTAWEEQDEGPPLCPDCGGMVRPGVVWFGESLPPGALEAAMDAAKTADVFLTIGTSAVVQPAASLPLHALQGGGLVVEINPVETALTPLVEVSLRGASGEVLAKLVKAVWES